MGLTVPTSRSESGNKSRTVSGSESRPNGILTPPMKQFDPEGLAIGDGGVGSTVLSM